MFESVSGIFVFECVVGLWGREAENAILYLYRKALVLASEQIRPPPHPEWEGPALNAFALRTRERGPEQQFLP